MEAGAPCGVESERLALFPRSEDAEWALWRRRSVPAKRGGRPRWVDVREVLNAIFYVLWTGCQWKALQRDLPPRSTVWDDLDRWTVRWGAHPPLYVEVREKAHREASPTPGSSAARARGGCQMGLARSVKLWSWQEGAWPQAPHLQQNAARWAGSPMRLLGRQLTLS